MSAQLTPLQGPPESPFIGGVFVSATGVVQEPIVRETAPIGAAVSFCPLSAHIVPGLAAAPPTQIWLTPLFGAQGMCRVKMLTGIIDEPVSA